MSSNKIQNRIHVFNPPRRGVPTTYVTCSYFPIARMDSSGEIFCYDDQNWKFNMVGPIDEVKNPMSYFKRE
jgi:hypothetical protein